jgi:hypothetical protein
MPSINSFAPSAVLPLPTSRPMTYKVSETTSSTVKDPQQTDSLWRRLGREYDLRDISIQETAQLSQQLYDGGEISLLDHAILSFDPNCLPWGGDTFLSEANNAGNHDLIAEFSARIELNRKMGDEKSLANNERVFDILQRLEQAKAGPFSVIA